MKIIEGGLAAPQAQIAIVISRFNSFINEQLLAGAVDTLKRTGQVSEDNITVVRVPGAVELPLSPILSVAVLASVWAFLFPALLWLSHMMSKRLCL